LAHKPYGLTQEFGMKNLNKNWQWIVFIVASAAVSQAQAQIETMDNGLSISDAIDRAKVNDPWITGSEFKQSKLNAMAVAAGQLSDPQVSIGVANIAADTFAFNQEPMTQYKVGVSQMFSRGQSRSLKTAQMNLLADEQPLLRANRMAMITLQTSHLWLDAYQAQESIRLIEKDRSLFEQLVDLVEASYSSGFGKTRQHDLIRAQLELTRLDDRLTQLRQSSESSSEQLRGYISQAYLDQAKASTENQHQLSFTLSQKLPEITLIDAAITSHEQGDDNQKLLLLMANHPAVKALDKQIEAENKGVDLANQKYKPAWGINASYGYRGDAQNSMSRADLFSVGVTFDLPLFTKNRQDQEVKAAVSSVAAKETQKTLLLRQLLSTFDQETAKLQRLKQRKELYEASLLPQMNQQVEASLTAYTHDDGDFAEVIRAKIAELNAQIDSLAIAVDMAKSKVMLNYLLAGENFKDTLAKEISPKNTKSNTTTKTMENPHE
jgi:outer membrane protein TolC